MDLSTIVFWGSMVVLALAALPVAVMLVAFVGWAYFAYFELAWSWLLERLAGGHSE